MNDYPEAEKVMEVSAQSQTIGEFLEWLLLTYTLCQWHEEMFYDEYWQLLADSEWSDYVHSEPAHFARAGIDINDIIAEYFNIDLDVYNDEKLQMLKELRKENSGGNHV